MTEPDARTADLIDRIRRGLAQHGLLDDEIAETDIIDAARIASGATLWIDVWYIDDHDPRLTTFGPFTSQSRAELAVIALAGRPDVTQAHIREPGLAS